MVMSVLKDMGVPMPSAKEFFDARPLFGGVPHRPVFVDGTIVYEPWLDAPDVLSVVEMSKRISILKSAGLPCFKLFPTHLGLSDAKTLAPILRMINAEYDTVTLERDDHQAHFLSLVRARRSNEWLRRPGWQPKAPPPSIVERREFERFRLQKQRFVEITAGLNVVSRLRYEDLTSNLGSIPRAFGLVGDAPDPQTVKQQSDYAWVSNYDEVSRWFEHEWNI